MLSSTHALEPCCLSLGPGLPAHVPTLALSAPPVPRRLRAALNSTQGLEPFFPLGQTPASGGPGGALLAGGRGARSKRASSLLRRDSESGVLSEK